MITVYLKNSQKWSAAIASLAFAAALPAKATLFDEIPSLSASAKNSLVAHYDGRTGVATTGNVVNSWTPDDGNGNPLTSMTVTSVARGTGAPELITYNDSTATLRFDDTADTSQGRYLSGILTNSAGTEFTVFWKGSYDSDAHFASSGTYAYNIGLNRISHQRDDASGGRWVVEMYNGTTYAGDDITAYDNTSTVWSTVITVATHTAYANGTNLNVGGTPANSVPANAPIVIGAFGADGYDLEGEISQLIIFQSALSNEDRKLVEAYLSEKKSGSGLSLNVENGVAELTWHDIPHILSSTDLIKWSVIPEAVSPITWNIVEPREFFRGAHSFEEVPSGVVLRTSIRSDTSREIEYHVDTGELYLVGERYHGFDYYSTGGNDLWWCYMNTGGRGNGLLEFLMTRNTDANAMMAAAVAGGWAAYDTSSYSFIVLQPLASHSTYVNQVAPAIPGGQDTTRAYTDDYVPVNPSGMIYALYHNAANGNVYIGVGGPGIRAVAGSNPPGDGTSDRDNGVRGDIAFKAIIPLSEEDKLELINLFVPRVPIHDDSSEAYYYVHPPGL